MEATTPAARPAAMLGTFASESEEGDMRPKVPSDLALAPVAAEIDRNLQLFRDEKVEEIFERIALVLNVGVPGASRADRAEEVLQVATRHVDLHGWKPTVSDDSTRLHLEGGSVTLDIGLSASIERYIENGAR